MMHKQVLSKLALLFAVTMSGSVAFSQSQTQGAVTGTVEDTSGAIVPGAQIVVHNNGTNAEVTLKADDKGYFNAPLLQPGDYTVTVTVANFATYVQQHVTVQVGQSTEVQPHLGVAGSAETVNVSEVSPAINFESPDFTTVLDEHALAAIPENNRRWSSLALLTPGVVSDSNGFGLVSVRGISPLLNNVLIDGADDNQAYFSEERGRTREAYSTSEDAVREFAVNTGVYSAEYGRAAGGVINSVTKSGTNNYHGEIYGYDRQSKWAAYTPLVTNTTATSNGAGGYTFNTAPLKPKDLRKIYGLSVGGPIIKDKLFFFYTYDQHSHIFPGIGKPANPATFFTLPDAALPAGDTCDPTTGLLYATAAGKTAAVGSTIDQQTCALAARQGVSYAQAGTNYSNGLAALLPDLGPTPRIGYQEINTPKLDYQINSKNRVALLYHRLRWDSPGGVQTQATVPYSIDAFGNDFVKLDYGLAKLNSVITNTISNEVGYQYSRELDYETQQPYSAYTLANLTGTGASAGNVPYVNLATSSGFNLGSPYYSYRFSYPDERKWQVFDTAYLVKGNHSIKVGLDILHNDDTINNLYEANGVFSYTYIGNYFADLAVRNGGGTKDQCNSTASSAASVTATKNATTGATTYTVNSAVGAFPCYSSFTEGFGLTPKYEITTTDMGFFVQDNWKVTPRLTLELGARYDYEKLPNASSALNAPTSVISATTAATLYSFTPTAGSTNRPSDKNNIGPRVGFAYDVYGSGKTVLRGGYGLYYGRMINATILNAYLNTGSPLGQYTTTFKTNQGGPMLANILPNVTQNSAGNVVQSGTFATPSTYFFDSNFQNPQVHEFDLIVQQQVGTGTTIGVSYLGSLGRELPNFANVNLNPATRQNVTITFAPPTTGSTNCGPVTCGTQVVVPTYVNGTYTINGVSTPLQGYQNTNFQGVTKILSNINSSYNAVAFELKNRSFHGLETDFSYTWSHALDYSQNTSTAASTTNVYDPYGSLRTNYGNSSFNVPNRVTGYALYNFPDATHNAYLKYVANGWSINDSFQGQSGLPYSYGTSSYNSPAATSTGYNGSGGISYLPFLGRNTLKLKRDLVDDIRVVKAIPFTERYKLELRGDFFNIANHQNVTSAGGTAYIFSSVASSPLAGTATFQPTTFGVPTSINSSGFLYTPREIQISARFVF